MTALALHLAALFVASALITSLLVGAALRLARRRLDVFEPASRARILLSGLAAPPLVAALVVGGVALPHQWLGEADHCLGHPGHLHLCSVHGSPAPDAVVWLVALFGILYLVHRLGRVALGALRGGAAVRRVLLPARREGDVWVLPGDAPLAFTTGLLRPAVVVSEGVLAEATRWRAVLEHERAHARRRDPLLRSVASALAAFHLPGVGAALAARLRDAQELAADDTSARAIGCRVQVAEALVDWMRWSRSQLDAEVGFHSGPFAARVRRLLDPEPSRPGPSTRALFAMGAVVAVAIGVAGPSLHHAVETAFGLLPS